MEEKSLTHRSHATDTIRHPIESHLTTDYLVIGKGLFGSAATRHLAKAGAQVVLVGGDEPAGFSTHTGVFASHYDEARIVSQSAPDKDLQQLDHASIAAYDEIERASGIPFFTPSGRLTAQPQTEEAIYPYLSEASAVTHPLSDRPESAKYPFCFPTNYRVLYEDAPSGHLNPRAMVDAQITSAHKHGAQLLSALLVDLQDNGSTFEAHCADGRVITAKKVLIATGAYANCFNLLPQKLAIRSETLTTVLCELDSETAARYRWLPPLNIQQRGSPLTHVSVLPPLRYPDQRHYIKLVLISPADRLLPDFDAITEWFRQTTTSPYLDDAKQLMSSLLPSINIHSWHIKPCIAAYTPTLKPMIDCLIDNRLYIALGGNGGSAHPSDAIGKLAADLMQQNAWQSSLEHTPFQQQLAADWSDWLNNPRSVWQTGA